MSLILKKCIQIEKNIFESKNTQETEFYTKDFLDTRLQEEFCRIKNNVFDSKKIFSNWKKYIWIKELVIIQ